MEEKRYCAVCGAELHGRQSKYCSKKCMGAAKQNYKTCPVCGKKFKMNKKNTTVCCSLECSKIHRGQLHKDGVYDQTMRELWGGALKKVEEIGPEKHWGSKHWVIESPDGKVYEVNNLWNFIRTNPELFDGTARQAFDGFAKIKQTMEGNPKRNEKSWKGWKLIRCTENKERYHGTDRGKHET